MAVNMKNFQCKSKEEAENRYGGLVVTNHNRPVWGVEHEKRWMELIVIPPFLKHVKNSITNKPWTKVYCNKDMSEVLIETLVLLHQRDLTKEIKTFDGCYNPRWVRGRPGVISWHSWGLALDLNAKDNPLGGECNFSKEFLTVWREMGWTVGADFKRVDAQHFQWGVD